MTLNREDEKINQLLEVKLRNPPIASGSSLLNQSISKPLGTSTGGKIMGMQGISTIRTAPKPLTFDADIGED